MYWAGENGEGGNKYFKGLLIHVSVTTQTAIVIQMEPNGVRQMSLRLITPLRAVSMPVECPFYIGGCCCTTLCGQPEKRA